MRTLSSIFSCQPVYNAMAALQKTVPTVKIMPLTTSWQRLLMLFDSARNAKDKTSSSFSSSNENNTTRFMTTKETEASAILEAAGIMLNEAKRLSAKWKANSERRRKEAVESAKHSDIPDQGDTASSEEKVELTDRKNLILETMVAHEITSSRRRQTRREIVRLINSKHNSTSYGRDFAALVKGGFLSSREGPDGGVWLTSKGKTAAEHLRNST